MRHLRDQTSVFHSGLVLVQVRSRKSNTQRKAEIRSLVAPHDGTKEPFLASASTREPFTLLLNVGSRI